MALSGSFSHYETDNFGLYCEWSAVQNTVGNYSDLTLRMCLRYKKLTIGAVTGATISINGVSDTFSTEGFTDQNKGVKTRLLKEKTVRIDHEEDGSKTGVVLACTWPCNAPVGSVSVVAISASDTVTLDTIDRAAPVITASVTEVTAGSVTISASASASCDVWRYKLDNAENWTQVQGTGSNKTFTISGLTVNRVYSILVSARKTLNQVYGEAKPVSASTEKMSQINRANAFNADVSAASFYANITINDSRLSNTVSICNETGAVIVQKTGLTLSAGTASRLISLTAAQTTTIQSAMSGLKKLNAIVKLKSYLSGSQVGPETSVPVTISVRENVSSPTVEGMTITDSNTDVTTLTGGEGFVQGASTLRVTPSRVKALYGASISKIAAFCGDMYAESHTVGALELGTLNMSGYTEVRLIVTDSRGFTVSLSETIKVDPHTRPALSAFALTRDDHSPADVSMSFTGSISSVYIDGLERNGIAYAQYRYKRTDQDAYGQFESVLRFLSVSGTSVSLPETLLMDLSASASFDVHLQLTDNFGGTLDHYFLLPQAVPLVSLRSGMVGINIQEPQVALHVDGGAMVTGEVKAASFSGSLAPSNLSSAVTVAKGGTGATSASSARSNLGIKATSLYNGTLTTGTTTFSYSSYKAYSIIGTTVSGTARCAVFVPKLAITTSNVTYCYSDGRDVQTFQLKYSGSTVTLTMGSEGGSILRIFGVN